MINILLNKQDLFKTTTQMSYEERHEILENVFNDAIENKIVIQEDKNTKDNGSIFRQNNSINKLMILLSIPIYKRMEEYINENKEDMMQSKNPNTKYSKKLVRFLSHPKSIYKNNTILDNYINCGKVDAVRIILEHIPSNEKVIIFSMFKNVLFCYSKELENMKINSIIFTGEDRDGEKIKFFKNDNSFKVLLTTTFKSAEGLNLQEANHVIILEFWWNPQIIFQAIGRIDRHTQKKDIFVYLLSYNKDNDIYQYEKTILERMKKKNDEAKKVMEIQPELPEIKVFSDEQTFKDELHTFLYDFNNPPKDNYFINDEKNVIDHEEIVRIEKERKEAEKIEKEEREKRSAKNIIDLYKEALMREMINNAFKDKQYDDIDFSGSK